MGTHFTKVLADGWTVVTMDGQPSAHVEHTIAITEEGPEVLTRVPCSQAVSVDRLSLVTDSGGAAWQRESAWYYSQFVGTPKFQSERIWRRKRL